MTDHPIPTYRSQDTLCQLWQMTNQSASQQPRRTKGLPPAFASLSHPEGVKC